MTEAKEFHIGDILSAMTGRLVSLDHIGGVYNILNWMTGDDLMTHQLPRASRECEPFLREHFPDLAVIDINAVKIEGEADVIAWFASIEAEYGTHRDVPRLPTADHTSIDPLAELKMLRPDAEVVVVRAD